MKAPRLLQSIFSAVGDLYLYKHSLALFGDCVAKGAVSFFSTFRRYFTLPFAIKLFFWLLLSMMYLTFTRLFSQLANWFLFFCFNRMLSNSLETVLTLVGLYYWTSMRSYSNKVPSDSRKWGLALAALACAIRPTSAITWVYVGLLELYLTHERLRFIFMELIPIGIVVLRLMCLLDRLIYGTWVLVPLNFLKFNFLSSGRDYYGTHKWHWFVLPMLPISLIFSGYSLAELEEHGSPNDEKKRSSCKWPLKKQLAIFFLLATNIPMALYMSLVLQRGTKDVMNYLSKEAAKEKVKNKGIPDESDRFMMDPASFAVDFAKNWSYPSHIVLFESEEKQLRNFLVSHSFRKVRRFFHAHFKVDRDL
ncbi:hypothetical protein REPUB_Repub03eG0128000 [Reevesia pubescens]